MMVSTVAGSVGVKGNSLTGPSPLNVTFGNGGPQGLAMFGNDLYIAGVIVCDA